MYVHTNTHRGRLTSVRILFSIRNDNGEGFPERKSGFKSSGLWIGGN